MQELTSRTWNVHEQDGTVYFTVPSFEQTGLVRHGFSSRIGVPVKSKNNVLGKVCFSTVR